MIGMILIIIKITQLQILKKNKKLVSFYYSKLLDLNSHMDYEHKVNEILANLNYGNNFFLNSLKLKSRVRSGLSYLHFLCLKLKKDTSESPNIFKRIRESFNISKMCRKKTQIIDYNILKQILFLKENINEDKLKAKKINQPPSIKKNTNTSLNLLELKSMNKGISSKKVTAQFSTSKKITGITGVTGLSGASGVTGDIIKKKNAKYSKIQGNLIKLCNASSNNNVNNNNKPKKDNLKDYIGQFHFLGNEKKEEKDNITNEISKKSTNETIISSNEIINLNNNNKILMKDIQSSEQSSSSDKIVRVADHLTDKNYKMEEIKEKHNDCSCKKDTKKLSSNFNSYKNFNSNNTNLSNKVSNIKVVKNDNQNSNLIKEKARNFIAENNSSNVNSASLSRSLTESSFSFITVTSKSSFNNSNISFADQNNNSKLKPNKTNTFGKKMNFKICLYNCGGN